MANSHKQSVLYLVLLSLINMAMGDEFVFKLSEMKHVGDHCIPDPARSAYDSDLPRCNIFRERTKSCRANRCSCNPDFMEVNFYGYLDCVVPAGKPCIGNLLFTNLMSLEDFKISISNFSELEQRRELAVYNVYLTHVLKSKEYAAERTPKDMSCASGRCGDDDLCTSGINSVFISNGAKMTSGKVAAITIGFVGGVFMIAGGFLLGYLYFCRKTRVNNLTTTTSTSGFNLL